MLKFGGEVMKGLFEAVLNLEVTNGTEKAYKKFLNKKTKDI